MLEVLKVSQVIARPKQDALTVLDQVSFGVPKGHLMGIIGATGSGKSSLIRLLMGADRATEGVIAFQGKDTAINPPHPIGRSMRARRR